MEIVSSFLSFSFLKKLTNFVKQITLLNSPSHLCKIFRFLINFTKIYHLLLLSLYYEIILIFIRRK